MYLATASHSAFLIIDWWKKKAFGDNAGHYRQLLMFDSHASFFGKEYGFSSGYVSFPCGMSYWLARFPYDNPCIIGQA